MNSVSQLSSSEPGSREDLIRRLKEGLLQEARNYWAGKTRHFREEWHRMRRKAGIF